MIYTDNIIIHAVYILQIYDILYMMYTLEVQPTKQSGLRRMIHGSSQDSPVGQVAKFGIYRHIELGGADRHEQMNSR